jgi:hypothetical protein
MVGAMRRHDYRCALGSVYPFDAAIPSVAWATHHVLRNARPGAVVILHDGGSRGQRTAQVLAEVLPELRRRGYRVVSLSELVAAASRKERHEMKGTLERAFGYQGDNMNLPVQDLSTAVPFYETVLGFRTVSRAETPHKAIVLGRDSVRIGLAENGGESLYSEFQANGLQKPLSQFDVERHDGVSWKVFYVVAPDGLCYWFGERQGPT